MGELVTQARAVFLLSICLLVGRVGDGDTVRADLRLGSLDLDGSIGAFTAGGLAAARADTDALGLGHAATVVQPRIVIETEDMHFDFMSLSADYSGNGIATATLDLGVGPPILVGAAVASELDLWIVTGTVLHDVAHTSLGVFGLGFGAGFVDIQMDVTGTTTGNRVSPSSSLPFAYLAGRLTKEFSNVELAANVGWIDWRVDREDMTYFSAELSVRHPFEQGNVALGYQLFDIDYEFKSRAGSAVAEATAEGPFLSLEYRF
jgi:hypothetical protein